MKHGVCFFTLGLLLFTFSFKAMGDPPTISHQGFIVDDEGQTLADGTYSFLFLIYETAEGGIEVWKESQDLEVSDGVFHAQLGINEPLDIPFDRPLWLTIEIPEGAIPLNPRIPLTAVPYAMHAYSIEAGSVTGEELADEAVSTNNIADGAVTPDKLAHSASSNTVTFDDFRADLDLFGEDYHNFGSLTVDASTSGTVMLFFSGNMDTNSEDAFYKVGIGSSEDEMGLGLQKVGIVNYDGTFLDLSFGFSPHAMVNVEAGNHTFYATLQWSEVPERADFENMQFSAIFIPH